MAEIYLDWNTHRLIGWEPEKSELVVEAIMRGIEAGADFPPVAVHRESENTYYISPLWDTPDSLPDGGHYRAIGHYLLRIPLKCQVLYGPPIPMDLEIPIEKIKLVPDSWQYAEHKNRFPNYL